MESPVAKFIPATHNVPTDEKDVFVIAKDGKIGTGHYRRWNGKGEWLVSFDDSIWRQPVWWATIPDISEATTGYHFNPEMVINY